MLNEYCNDCGEHESIHSANQAESARYISIMQSVIAHPLPQEHRDALEQILHDWRTHTLPTCDPLSYS
jgi:hypothetical protein